MRLVLKFRGFDATVSPPRPSTESRRLVKTKQGLKPQTTDNQGFSPFSKSLTLDFQSREKPANFGKKKQRQPPKILEKIQPKPSGNNQPVGNRSHDFRRHFWLPPRTRRLAKRRFSNPRNRPATPKFSSRTAPHPAERADDASQFFTKNLVRQAAPTPIGCRRRSRNQRRLHFFQKDRQPEN